MALTMTQALNAQEFHQTGPFGRECTAKNGPLKWRRNGKTKVWVRKPQAFRIPVKWGLKTYDYIDGLADDPTTNVFIHAAEDCPVTA